MNALLNPSPIAALTGLGVLLALLRWRLPKHDFYALLIGSIVALAIGESVCRVAGLGTPTPGYGWEARTKGTGAPWAYVPGSRLVFSYPDNPRGYFDANNEVVGYINSRGFRWKEVEVPRRPGTFRLTFIGDSFTLGYGVKDEHTLPTLVEGELRKQDPNVEVLNFGVTGSNPGDEIALLKRYVLRFQPNAVVAVLFLNDAGGGLTVRFLGRARYFTRIRRYSRLIDATVGAIESGILSREMARRYNKSFADESPGYRRIQDALLEGHALADKVGFKFVVVLYPVLHRLNEDCPFRSIHRKIEGLCKRENIDFVDLLPAFLGHRDRALWVHSTDQHPNEVANQLAAIHLAGRLRAIIDPR